MSIRVAGIASILVIASAAATGAAAQSSQNYSSSNMWGTVPAGVAVNGALDSALAHEHNGIVAAQVNAAKKGLLIGGGPGLSITAIGSQSIVSNTVVGNNNSTNISANQTTSNSGSVSNNGTIVSP